MKTRGLGAIALTSLVLAGTASAANAPTLTATVTPNKAGAASGFSIAIPGPLPSGIPSQLVFTAQNGFTSDGVKAVTATCTLAQAQGNMCPAGSDVGTGSAGTNILGTLNFTLAAGAPQQAGDIATVYLIGQLAGATIALPGRLMSAPGGGLELSVAFPPLPIPGLSLTSLQLTAKGTNTVTTYTKKKVKVGHGKKKRTKIVKVPHKTTYSVLRNPSTCPSTGMWTGSVSATYAAPTGTVTLPFTAACTS
jgi:hypothetical protein